jgi:AmmeMemoRadiSam system protein A
VKTGKTYEPPAPASEALNQERGAFVTLTERGALRGCIGYVAPFKPLYITVRDVARFAALEDRRFSPVVAAELSSLDYEISVLSPMRRVLDTKEIVVGQDGLLIREGGSEGLLLPQVATEQKWNRAEFLREVSLKAGLPPTAWEDSAADLFRFTALVFGEERGM